ncbi:Ydr279p protein family-domain-containing protein [Cunninghamella echinulata]|nr:Ydr279p protein family-domain-containing protein [Cunninghamella echinulata]
MSNIKHLVAFTNIKDEYVQSLLPISLPCARSGRIKKTLYKKGKIKSIYILLNRSIIIIGKLSTFLYHESTLQLYELSKVAQGRKSCWLVKDTIFIDGAIHFINRMDPLFIALFILKQQNMKQEQFRTVDDIFAETDFHRIINDAFCKQLLHLCDTQEIAQDMFVYRFNQEKSLQWLKQKIDTFLSHLENIPVFNSEVDNIKEEDKKREYYLRECIYIFAKYLSNDWLDLLFENYGIAREEQLDENIAAIGNQPSVDDYFKLVGKNRVDDDITESVTKKAKPSVPRSLAKVNTKGIKPLTSFFKAKNTN